MQDNIKTTTLDSFPLYKSGKIYSYDNEELKMPTKILEMGLLPDTYFVILHKAPFGGPIYIEYGEEKTHIALRVEEAKFILVEAVNE